MQWKAYEMDLWECQVFKTITKNTQEQSLSTTMPQEKYHQAQKKKQAGKNSLLNQDRTRKKGG